jgi:hypothetical protein
MVIGDEEIALEKLRKWNEDSQKNVHNEEVDAAFEETRFSDVKIMNLTLPLAYPSQYSNSSLGKYSTISAEPNNQADSPDQAHCKRLSPLLAMVKNTEISTNFIKR